MAELVSQGPFASISEERTARRLAEELPDKWLIVCNKMFVSPRGEQFEVDYIIVGRHHIFVADEKNISGQVRSNENDWTLSSGQLRRNPLNKLHLIAGRLAGYIIHQRPLPATAHRARRAFRRSCCDHVSARCPGDPQRSACAPSGAQHRGCCRQTPGVRFRSQSKRQLNQPVAP